VEIVVNKEGVGSGVLAIDSLVCCSPIAVSAAAAAAAALDDEEAVIA
jgi:hypothetical protein